MIGATRDIAAELAAEALFVSDLQPSQRPSAGAVERAVAGMIRQHGDQGCAALVAAEFGDHPETAVGRMAWARAAVSLPARMAGVA